MKEYLKTVYESVTFKDWVRFDVNKFSGNIGKELSGFNRDIILRDFREAGVALLLFIIFCYRIIFSELSTSQTISSWVMLFACVLIVAVMYWGRTLGKDIYTLPTIEFLRMQRKYLIRQRNLLRNVLYWYMGPLMLSYLIGFWDRVALSFSPDESSIVKVPALVILGFVIVFIIGLTVVIYILNRKAAKNVQLIIEEVDKAIADLEE